MVESKKHPNWGGRRPGAGRKPKSGTRLTSNINIRVSDEQQTIFQWLGGADWVRAILQMFVSTDKTGDGRDATVVGNRVGFLIPSETGPSLPVALMPSKTEMRFVVEPFDETRGEVDAVALLSGKAEKPLVVQVAGEGLVDAGINEGDHVVIDRNRCPQHHDIVLANVEGRLLFKRYLESKNSANEAPDVGCANTCTPFVGKSGVEVLGVVVSCVKHLHQ